LSGSRRREPNGRRANRRRDAGVVTGEDRLLLVAGLALEARGLLRRLPPAARRALTVETVGPRAARLDRLDLAQASRGHAALLVTGLVGGCQPDLRPGDVVVGDSVATPWAGLAGDGGDPGLRARAVRALEAARLRYRIGRLLTVDEIVTSPAAKAEWWRTHGVLAVDMESAYVLAWARRAGLPALAVRAVADGPEDEVPRELLGAVGVDGRMRAWAVVSLLGRPALVGAAWRLGRRSRRALGSLARFVRAFVTLPSEP
jgi:adenosylhomocysteine nucleosidase